MTYAAATTAAAAGGSETGGSAGEPVGALAIGGVFALMISAMLVIGVIATVKHGRAPAPDAPVPFTPAREPEPGLVPREDDGPGPEPAIGPDVAAEAGEGDPFAAALERLRSGQSSVSDPKDTMAETLADGVLRLGPAAAADLVEVALNGDAKAKLIAARVLAKVQGAGVGPLVDALSAADGPSRWWAAKTLGEIGDPSAVPALEAAAGDPDDSVSSWARWALDRIQGSADPTGD